jgi:hypothetical protein
MLKNLKEDDIIDPLFDDSDIQSLTHKNELNYDQLIDELFIENNTFDINHPEFAKKIKIKNKFKIDDFNVSDNKGNDYCYSDDELVKDEDIENDTNYKYNSFNSKNNFNFQKSSNFLSLNKYKFLVRSNR